MFSRGVSALGSRIATLHTVVFPHNCNPVGYTDDHKVESGTAFAGHEVVLVRVTERRDPSGVGTKASKVLPGR